MNKPRIAFFGTPHYAVMVLEKLHAAGLTPELIVTAPDAPKGRNLVLTPPPVKVWADEHKIETLQPTSLKNNSEIVQTLTDKKFDVFVVIAYGKIIPLSVLSIPKHGTLNIHGSLLPKLRGASPIETAILEDVKETGPTIMLIDEEMDHGPIIAQKAVDTHIWPLKAQDLGKEIVESGADLLIEILPDWIDGKLEAKAQDHAQATYTKKIRKEDGEIKLTDDPYLLYRKFQAFHQWPQTYFFVEKDGKKIRVIIKDASYKNGVFSILKVVPEGKTEVDFETFSRAYLNN